MDSLETVHDLRERLRKLEEYRISALGRVNACETLLISAWGTILKNYVDDPVGALEWMRQTMLAAADTIKFQNVAPEQRDVVAQEYRKAIESLINTLIPMALTVAKTNKNKKTKGKVRVPGSQGSGKNLIQ